MGVRIDKIESDVKNNTMNLQDARTEMRTIRTLWNAVTIATFLAMVTLFVWLDGKSDVKFNNLMSEIRMSNESVNAEMRQVKAEVKQLSVEVVKINHSLAAITKDHDKLKK